MKRTSLIFVAFAICIFAASGLFATNLPGQAPDPTKPDAVYETVDEGGDEITGYQQKWEPYAGKSECECPAGSRDPECGQMIDDLSNPIYTWVPNLVQKLVSPGCIKIQISFGHAVHNSEFSNGNIYIIKERPSPTIFSP